MSFRIRYKRDGYGDDVYECDSGWNPRRDAWWAIEDAAEDFYSVQGGWESLWPIVFVLVDEAGAEIARAEVSLELEPAFYADNATYIVPPPVEDLF